MVQRSSTDGQAARPDRPSKVSPRGEHRSRVYEPGQGLPPAPTYLAKDWREQIRAHLEAKLEAGATLYGIRPEDGAYVARTKDGEKVLKEFPRKPE